MIRGSDSRSLPPALGGAPPARHDAPRRVPEEADGTVIARIMKHLLPVLLLCAACNTPPAKPDATADLQMQVVRLEYRQASELVEPMKKFVASQPPSMNELKIATQPNQNALVLSGTKEQVRAALELVARLDIPPAR